MAAAGNAPHYGSSHDGREAGARRRAPDRQADQASEHGAAGHAAAGLGLDDADFPVLLRGAEMDIMHACGSIG